MENKTLRIHISVIGCFLNSDFYAKHNHDLLIEKKKTFHLNLIFFFVCEMYQIRNPILTLNYQLIIALNHMTLINNI